MFFLNQEINPATTSNPESKSKPRLNIKDIEPSDDIKANNDIKPRIKEQTQQRHFPLFEIQIKNILVIAHPLNSTY